MIQDVPFDGFPKAEFDEEIDERIADHCKKYGMSPLDAVRHFAVLARRQMLKRFLAHTDIFKMTLGVPGDIAELGVFRGLGLMTWANLLESYCIGDRTKIVWGFDNWEGFTNFSEQDHSEDEGAQKVIGGFDPGNHKQELLNAIDIFDSDRFIPRKQRIKLVEGNIEATAPVFVKENPGVRFSLIHFDCDLYEPTRAALEAFWPKVSRGGVLMFDEYGIHNWPGETQAVDEFMADKPDLKLQTLDWTNTPAAFLVKP